MCFSFRKNLQMKNIVITGTGRGIGLATAEALLGHKDVNVIAITRNPSALDSLKYKYPERLFPVGFLLTSFGEYPMLGERIRIDFDTVDVVIHNAGVLINHSFEKLSANDFDTMFDVNVKVPFILTQTLLPLMSKGSHVLGIGSMGGYQGSAKFAGLSLYSASKGALAVLMECLAAELEANQIAANCLSLGAVQTEILAEAFPGYKAPLTPGQMGEFIANFALTGHHYFRGKILPVSLSTP